MADIHKQDFQVRDLLTRSVTLFPSRAQVVRDIDNVILKPGANEITIYGLTPSLDESSVKVDGKGSAIITDMVVELVPNRERFDDIYPDESDDDDVNEFLKDSDTSEDEDEDLTSVKQEMQSNTNATKQADEEKASALGRLTMLEEYAISTQNDRPQDLQDRVKLYTEVRKKAFGDHIAGEAKLDELKKERQKLQKKYDRALRTWKKKRDKATKERNKLRSIREEKSNTKRRVRQERLRYWPIKVYQVILSLDTSSDMTPASSRRGSVDSLPNSIRENPSDYSKISLSMSYITNSAWWSPHYDLSLNTTTNSGALLYRAESRNATSETWKDAKLILSTSQAAFQGLGETLPVLQPWNIRLGNGGLGARSTDSDLMSTHEKDYRQKNISIFPGKTIAPRNALFATSENSKPSIFGNLANQQTLQKQQTSTSANSGGLFGSTSTGSNLFGNTNSGNAFGGFGNTAPTSASTGGTFGSTSAGSGFVTFGNPPPTSANMGGLFGSAYPGSSSGGDASSASPSAGSLPQDQANERFDEKAETIVPEIASLDMEDSEWSETGMTTSYEIPGVRSIVPSDNKRRHKIASIDLKDVRFSYSLVPKLRAVAFLKACIRNTSSISLLKGPAGLTLDGSFLGTSVLPHCSAGQTSTFNLGVDPSIKVTYSKPVVKRSQTGVFQKEGSGIITRSCTITNTKPDRLVEAAIQDQVPVSEDERLKVEIFQPSGLRKEGDSVKSGIGIAAVGKVTEKWGSGKATLKKDGEVCWNLKIEGGRGVKLVLEYETRYPSNETVVAC